MDFLQLADKTVLVCGLANRKSVAYHVGQTLVEAGARVAYVVRTADRRKSVARLVGESPVLVCDVEHPEQITRLRDELAAAGTRLHGLVHSIAAADYSTGPEDRRGLSPFAESTTPNDAAQKGTVPLFAGGFQKGPKPFHETPKTAFLRAMDISCYSLIALSEACRDLLDPDGSVVTVSISTTRMASESYGYMAPVKAALDSALVFLAKSFSRFSCVRFNAVAPGLLKTSASAGIPGYVDAYLFAEQATLRGRAVQTEEVAQAVAFLLSPRSSGINAQRLVVDAGMSVNYFDRDLIRRALRPDNGIQEPPTEAT